MTGPQDANRVGSRGITGRTEGVFQALDGAEVGIFVLGPDFTVEWLNETVEAYFGLEGESVLGRDKRDLVDSTVKTIFERPERFAGTVLDTYADNTYVEEFECHVLPGDERAERWLLHRSRPIETGPLAGGRVEQYTDVTERKEREQALRRERDRLEEFAGVVSHDLRNPLRGADGRRELARAECDSEHLAPSGDALDRMERIVDDVLWLAREGRDIGETEPVGLRESVASAWELVTDEVHGADLVSAFDGDRTVVRADRDRFRQLLENILRNAVEHGSTSPPSSSTREDAVEHGSTSPPSHAPEDAVEHGRADVTVRVERTPEGFAIEDDGPGIPPAERDRVFEAGYSTSEQGTGFGLRIVEQVVDAHGWDVSVTEGTGGGTRLEITGVEFLEE